MKLLAMMLVGILGSTCLAEIDAGEFSAYVHEFQNAAKKYGPITDLKTWKSSEISISHLRVRFSRPGDIRPEGELAYCEWQDDVPTVVIDRDSWGIDDQKKNKMVMFHELGHCVLDREHCEGMNIEGYPNSLMASQVFDPTIYYAHEDYYLQELFWTGPHSCGKQSNQSFSFDLDQLTKRTLKNSH